MLQSEDIKMGHKITWYIDGYICFGIPSDAKESFDCLYGFLMELGFTISSKKLIPTSIVVTCLLIEVSTEKDTLSIPSEKMVQISSMLQTWKSKKICTKRQLHSLLGHLLYIHNCVKPARYLLNRILEVLINAYSGSHIGFNPSFHRDLRWFLYFLPYFNGVALYDHKKYSSRCTLMPVFKIWGVCFTILSVMFPFLWAIVI